MRTQHFTWTNNAWAPLDDTFLVYDGMNVVQERDGTNNTVKAMYTRGLDMGGGIAGILCRSTSSGNFSFHYDGAGNVTQLTDSTGTTVGRYTYDAFGNTLEARGTAAADNPYRFSTKAAVDGLYDYGLRFYAPSLGKWINRDSIREKGGSNLYGFIGNKPTNSIDLHGCFGVPDSFVGAVLNGAITGAINWAGGGSFWMGALAGAIGGFIGGFFDNPAIAGAVTAAVQQALLEIADNKCGMSSSTLLRIV